MKRTPRIVLAALVAMAAVVMASPAPAYVPNTPDYIAGVPIITHWALSSFPVAMTVTPGLTTDINDGTDREALDSAMASWSSVSGSAASIFVEREAEVEANVFDGINAIEFSNDPALGGSEFVSLTLLLTELDGTIVEADVLVNDRVVGFTTTAGSNVGLDLETAMLQELGRVLGLTSSPLGALDTDGTVEETSAVMYPVTRGISESARALRQDDAAGMVGMYPAGGNSASISGFVTRDGRPVFGAQVVANDPIEDVLVSAVTLPDGSYEIAGLPPGRYLMEARPLIGAASPATLGGIFDSEFVDTTFSAEFFTVTVRVAAGEHATDVSVVVD